MRLKVFKILFILSLNPLFSQEKLSGFILSDSTNLPLENVTILPSAAVTIDGKIFILEDENRLKELVVNILRRQGDEVIVSGAPIDKEYVMQFM